MFTVTTLDCATAPITRNPADAIIAFGLGIADTLVILALFARFAAVAGDLFPAGVGVLATLEPNSGARGAVLG